MEIFGRESQVNYRNMVDDPYLNAIEKGNVGRRRGYNACCGLNATGDEEVILSEPPAVKAKVQSIQTWQFVKTGLALIGLYVAVMYVYHKIKK